MDSSVQELLISTIFPDLERGRPNWDKPHTECVVDKIFEIKGNNPDLDIDWDVIVIAGYAHDWGYADLFQDDAPIQFRQIQYQKIAHMEIGARKISELLNKKEFSFLSQPQKDRITHLVLNHDRLDRINATDERILVEADTLAQIDVTKVTPTFDKDSNEKYMKKAREKRLPLFLTQYSRNEFERLAIIREEYYNSL